MAHETECETCKAPIGSPCVALRNRGERKIGDPLPSEHETRRMKARFGLSFKATQTQTNAPTTRDMVPIDQALARGKRVYEIMREFGVTENDVYARMDHLRLGRAG